MACSCLLTCLSYLLILVGGVACFKGLCALFTFFNIALTQLNSKWASKFGKGSWAVVTGCTEGIGKAFCFELASLGFNLVLVSRNGSKLEALNKQLWQKHPDLNTVICQTDFSTYNRSLYDHIADKTSNLDISILVNNVGISHRKTFDQQSLKEVEEQININVAAMTFLSHRFIPSFLERKHQSAIVNLSSQSIVYNLRTLSVYTGTKAYNNSFSKCLSEDYKDRIQIVDCGPNIVSTAGTFYTKDPMSCTSQECARWSLKALGKTNSTVGHWKHILQSWGVFLAGETFTQWLANKKLDEVSPAKTE